MTSFVITIVKNIFFYIYFKYYIINLYEIAWKYKISVLLGLYILKKEW